MNLVKKFSVFALMIATVVSMSGGLTVKAAGNYNAGSLLAKAGVSGAAVYYIGSDGMKYVFPDVKTYNTWYENFDNVVKVSVAELDMYPDGGAVTYRAGMDLVTNENSAKVYAVEPGGVLRWIPTAETASALYGANWGSKVKNVIPGFFSSSYTVGSDLGSTLPTGTIAMEQGGTTYYYISGTTKRPFASMDAFEANNFNLDYVVTANLSGYTAGTSITGGELALSGFMPAEGGVVTPAGTLSVSLASNTPASTSIISDSGDHGQSMVNFVNVRFAASADGAVTVNTVKFKRSGVSSDTDLSEVYLYDGDTRIAEGGSISSGVVTFNDASGLFTVSAGSTKTISLRGDLEDSLGGGKTIAFGIDSASDVTTAAGSVSGSFPATGNMMTTASVDDLGYVKLSSFTTPTGSNTSVAPDQTDFEVWPFTLQAVDQKVEIEKLVITEVGSIQVGDLTNFRLLANGTEVASAEMANDYTVTFDLDTPLEILSGNTKTMSLRADIVKGSTKTFYFSFQNLSDIVARDMSYGVYVPAYDTVGTWTIIKPTGNYSIDSGAVTVNRSTDSPTTNVAVDGTNVTLAKFDFKASGEDMKIKNLDVLANTNSYGGLDNGKVLVDGVQVGSTKDLTEDADVNFTFGSSFIIPAGTTKVVSIVADVKTATSTSYADTTTVTVSVGAGASNAQGMSSLQTSNVPSSDRAGNALTMTASALSVSKYSAYGDQTFVAGTNAAKLGSFVLTTGAASGVSVNSVTVALSADEAATVTNMYLMVDGQEYGTTKATPSTSNVYSETISIPANGAKVFEVYADILANANPGAWTANIDADGTATVGNGSVSATALNIQTITVGTGTLSVSDGSHPDGNIILATTANNEFAEFTFSAANEDYTISEMRFTIENNFATSTAGISLEYTNGEGDTEVADGIFIDASGTYYATFTGLDMYVPKDDEATVKVYIDTSSIANGATSGANGKVTLKYNSGFKATGTSGTVKTSVGSADLSGNTFYLRKSKPTFAKVNITSTTPTSDAALFKFSVVADSLGTIDIKQLGFTVTTSGVTVTALKLYNSDTGTAITDTGVDADGSGYVKLLVGAVDNDVLSINTTVKYYEVRGTLAGWGQSGDEITVVFKQDASAVSGTGNDSANDLRAGQYNIWSDRSASAHTTATEDWTNGYLLKEMTGSHTFSKS
jgi:hypothetical protein